MTDTECIMEGGFYQHKAMAAGDSLEKGSVSLKKDSVRVGKQIFFIGDVEKYSFRSSDSEIAYVSDDGRITGKKQGDVVITATEIESGQKKKFDVTVEKNGNKPVIKVCPDEVFVETPVVVERNGENVIALTVRNNSPDRVVKKGKCSFNCVVVSEKNVASGSGENGEIVPDSEESGEAVPDSGENGEAVLDSNGNGETAGDTGISDSDVVIEAAVQKITVGFGKIQPGEEKIIYYSELERLVEIQEIDILSLTVFSGEAKVKCNMLTDTLSYGWGTEDMIAPVIRGFVGERSANGKDVYIVLYKDRKTAYKKYVTAYDDRDGEVAVKADFSEVNWDEKGQYTLTVTAEDSAGNKAKRKMKVQVRCLTGMDLYADSVLKKITKPGWSEKAVCKAIYRYVQSHMSYVNYNGGKSWESAALRGLRYGNGNCYAYYSLSRLLMTRAGIPNIMVTRYPAVPNHHHWWNLAYVNGGWYHFDTVPRRLKGRFCLLTDAQMQAYERRSPGTFRYSSDSYPKRAKKVICSGPF